MAGLRRRILVFLAASCAWSRASPNSVARSYLRLNSNVKARWQQLNQE